ncbi:MAG: MBL fold metallo-hydrolase, partial [Candidatus Dadabacteria bacterium]|nr:MBL fold metallo-hydrolase [Candidatus Dadabacteria bacterium]
MILKQYYLGCLAHASYMIASRAAGQAVVVDPQRDIDQYLEDADTLGVEIKHVFLTHFHADFLAGHLELRDRVGSKIYLGARAKADYEFVSMKDGDVLEFEEVRLKILETPGHSPESISILVFDLSVDEDDPYAVLTGDTLFIGDVGRPDLRASLGWSAEQLGGMLYDSIHNKLLKLADHTLIYPAHGAGSLCGKKISEDTVSTIGDQKSDNYALQDMTKDEFIEIVTENQPDAPAYFTYDAVLNTKEHQTLDTTIEKFLNPISLDELLELQKRDVQLLDVRDPEEYASVHLAGSINIGLGGKFATWAGTILDNNKPILIVADIGTEHEAATRLGRIGYDNLSGFLEQGMGAVKDRNEILRSTPRLTVKELYEQFCTERDITIVDVRSRNEWSEGHINNSVNIPLNHLKERITEIPRDKFTVVHCQAGYRSSVACSI